MDFEGGEFAGEAGFGEGLVAVVVAGPGAVGQGMEGGDEVGREEAGGAGASEDGAEVVEKLRVES